MSGVVVGVVGAVVASAVGLAPMASAAVTTPTIVSQGFDPARVVFASTDAIAVSGTVEVEEPAGWTFDGAFVPDLSCTPAGQLPTPDCPALLTSSTTSTSLDFRSITVSGDVPNTLADGSLNRSAPGPRIYLRYTDDTGAAQLITGEPAYSASGALRSRLSGPASLPAGSALTLTALDEGFTTQWDGVSGWAMLEFMPDSTGTWTTTDAQYADSSGAVAFHRPAVSQSGVWRVRLDGSPVMYSNELRVNVVAAPPPPAGTPPSAPTAAVAARTFGSIAVAWGAPTRPNGALVAYRWGWTSATGQPRRSWTRQYAVHDPALRRPFVVGGLAPRTTYRVWVQAVNAHGAGAKRTVVATTLRDPAHRPSAPRRTRAKARSHRVVLRWALPAATGGAAVSSYQVRLGKGQVREVGRSTRRAVFTGLRNGRRYRVSVRAHNRVGYGPWARTTVRLPATRRPHPAPHPTPAPHPQPHADCTAGYSPCIAPGPDVDCAGGSGNGPRYVSGPVRVTGSDPYGLDADGDGVACES